MVLRILIPEKVVYDGEAKLVTFNGYDGEMSVYDNHMPIFTQIRMGEIIFENSDGKHFLAVGAGIAHIVNNTVIIAIDTAIFASDINEKAVIDAREAAEKLLSQKIPSNTREILLNQIRMENLKLQTYTKFHSQRTIQSEE